uniref:uncharacterized protein LOC101301697 isoform X2 n=1 Tax=Fragaria vesca subsp. vesca TaxID=101020 RepID=UPI0005C94E25|nr:PREDICTED: uncharacterized protein LOC101301697 isoform X2 [Fragaria vesca subsp. vesca]
MIPTYAAKATHLNQSRQQSAIDSSTLSFSPLSARWRWKRASYCSRNPVLEFEGHVLVAIFSGVLIGPGCLKFSSSVRRNRILFGGLTKRMTENVVTDVIQALEGVEGKHTLFKGTNFTS